MNRISFKEALQNGIMTDSRIPVNAPWLKDAQLLSCTPFGAKAMRSFQQPITDAALAAASPAITKAYPFPQLFVGKSVTLLADATAIYSVTKSDSGNWTIESYGVIDWEQYITDGTVTTGTIPTGKEWHFVDLWDKWMLFNESCVVFSITGGAAVQSTVTIQTGASYNDGQIFYGGFDSSNVYDLADWPTYMATFQGTLPAELRGGSYSTGMGPNWTWWSSVGADDMYRFFWMEYMKHGPAAQTFGATSLAFPPNMPYWMQFASLGESAPAPMPWTGTVKRMMQCGNTMVVYGTNGVNVISCPPMEVGVHQLPGFGTGVGVCEGTTVRLAVGGNEQVHAFVDERRDLWLVENNGGMPKATNLGYRHIFAAASNIMVHYDAGENEFYFTASTTDWAYRLPIGGGLSKSPFVPTTVSYGRANSASGPVGIRTLTSDNTTALIETNWIDNQGMPVVPNAIRIIIQVDPTDTTTTLQAALVFKRFPNEPIDQTTGYILADHRGVVKIPPTSFYMAYVQVKSTDRTTININDIIVEFDDGTRRSIASWHL